jgi:hypothetical protein
MDCRNARAVAALAFAFGAATGLSAPDQVRGEIASRQRARLPALAMQDYAVGAGAIDGCVAHRGERRRGRRRAAAGRKPDGEIWDGRTPPMLPQRRTPSRPHPQYDARLKRIVTLRWP